jgi:hypothetical protein
MAKYPFPSLPFLSGDDLREMNSAELLAQYRDKGSEEAFAELVRSYTSLVFSVAWRRLGSAALAEEAAQAVFARFAQAKPKLSSEYAVWDGALRSPRFNAPVRFRP